MPIVKLPPLQNVAANQTAVLPAIPQGWTYENIFFKLGGTTFTKSLISSIRLWLGGKKIWEVTGSHLDSINQYFRLTSTAAYLTMHFANPRALSLADRMIGAIVFQSAPAQLSGRYEARLANLDVLKQFQSAPAQLSGRYPLWGGPRRPVNCFNPRPLN